DFLNELIDLFNRNLQITPEEMLIKINRLFFQVNKYKKERQTKIINAAIILEIKNKDIIELQKKILDIIHKMKLKAEKIKKPHVSTAYLIGQESFSNISLILKNISSFNLEFIGQKIELLKGSSLDYIALELVPPENFWELLTVI